MVGTVHIVMRLLLLSFIRTAYSTAPMLNLMPAKTVSLQCVSLTSVERRHCETNLQQQISLMWVDQAGAKVQEDSQHRIIQQSPCDKTLIVTFQSPEDKKFRCQATVGEEVQTSVEVLLRAPDLKGKGRGILIEPEPEPQGGKQDTVGAAVGVVGCLVLTVVVAVFVVNRRRRTNSQQPDEPCSVQSSPNNVMNTDVIYADIILPGGSDRVWVHEYESTEYACVRYK
ncbi:uncharacterized protein AKAME5_001167300 [Lates japonicus]|uniref:Ig-like domain-containing protein n=1 Tax=Lates japonicus TaxID=270547 RepID=A0AAD3MTR7_LATJO|nr:uncharacterized protein AKAME5_001167300 [Lates japonicus]